MDIVGLADSAMEHHRVNHLNISAAVWKTLREKDLANKRDAPEIAKRIFRELQKRSTARRKKNSNRAGRVMGDIFATIRERGGDPED